MTKTEWQHRIVDLQEQNFINKLKDHRDDGLPYVKAAIQAYKDVFTKEGK